MGIGRSPRCISAESLASRKPPFAGRLFAIYNLYHGCYVIGQLTFAWTKYAEYIMTGPAILVMITGHWLGEEEKALRDIYSSDAGFLVFILFKFWSAVACIPMYLPGHVHM